MSCTAGYDILGTTMEGLASEFALRYGKEEYHAQGLFQTIYEQGHCDVRSCPRYRANPALAERVSTDFCVQLPPVARMVDDGNVTKIALRFSDGLEAESVLIPMPGHLTLCVSCQIGCARGCAFCRTGRMGLSRDLSAAEIVSQLVVARFVLRREVDRIVFMGMGEPMGNLDQVLLAVRILADQRGLAFPHSAVSISTVGDVQGMATLARLSASGPRSGYRNIRLALSLNGATEDVRARLMGPGLTPRCVATW